ncbi:MAG: hypothetical protein ACR2PF_16795, partial [Rhizobiaceae bacterium]
MTVVGIKTILVPVESVESSNSVLNAALLLGRDAGGYIEGCPVRIHYPDAMAVGPMGGAMVSVSLDEPSFTPEELHKSFVNFMQKNGVPPASVPDKQLCFGWTGNNLFSDPQFGGHARVFDVVVVGRPNAEASGPRVTTVECCLFEGGRPVLVAPPAEVESLGQTVVVAWNCSTEAARSVS